MDTNSQTLIRPLSEHLAITLSMLLRAVHDGQRDFGRLSFMVSTQCSVIANDCITAGSYEELCSAWKPTKDSPRYRHACICGYLAESAYEPWLVHHCHSCEGKYYNNLQSAIPQGFIDLLKLTIFHLRMNFAPENNRLLEIHISQLEHIIIKYLNSKDTGGQS
jgi:hypothetical protein